MIFDYLELLFKKLELITVIPDNVGAVVEVEEDEEVEVPDAVQLYGFG